MPRLDRRASGDALPPTERGTADKQPLASVIIPAHNEAEHLRECLQSLAAQDYRAYEVIVVDNGSTDATAQICAQFPAVRYIYFDQCKSSYAARNEGARHARGEILVFFDADQTAMRHCLSLLLQEYVPNDERHVYCGRLVDDPRIPSVVRTVMSQESLGGEREGRIRTACVAVPRKLFDRLGGFKAQLVSGGDFEFFGRAVEVATVHVCQQPGAFHYWARSAREVLQREERYAFGACLRAREEGRPVPGALKAIGRVLLLGLVKLGAAALVPLRYPRGQWKESWQALLLHWRAVACRARGIIKYKLGARRAGDLPRAARASARPEAAQKELH